MESTSLTQAHWYIDEDALSRDEPGIRHSFMASLATTLNHITDQFDPVQLMGSSAFAFRIWVNRVFCPSAMSVFEWDRILPEAVRQSGFECTHVARMWNEDHLESERRHHAHLQIVHSLNRGRPVICWDVQDAEWGVITGYCDQEQSYHAVCHTGAECVLPFDRLGRYGVNVLSVVTIGERAARSPEEVMRGGLQAAVDHADQKEWMDRPDYQDGLPAFDLWATMCDRWASILDAGGGDRIGSEITRYAAYYAEHFYSARSYATKYLRQLTTDHATLVTAAKYYQEVAEMLRDVVKVFAIPNELKDPQVLRHVGEIVRSAAAAEKRAVGALREFLSFSAS